MVKARFWEITVGLYRDASRIIAGKLLRLCSNLRPNHVTVFRLVFIPLAMFFFLSNHIFVALTFFHLFIFFDYVDGSVAHLRSMTTKFGGWLDSFADLTGYSCVNLALIWNLCSQHHNFSILHVTISNALVLVAGISIFFALFMNILFPSHTSMLREKFQGEKRQYVLQKTTPILQRTSPLELVLSFAYLITFFGLLGQMFIALIIMALAHNLRWLYLLYYYKPNFYIFRGELS